MPLGSGVDVKAEMDKQYLHTHKAAHFLSPVTSKAYSRLFRTLNIYV
jgi:hypothetical protein